MSTEAASPVLRDGDSPKAGALLLAGVHLISTHGFDGTSVSDIASAAGVSAAALYLHFDSKHDLLLTILDRGGESLLRVTEDALFGASPDAASRLDAVVGAHVRQHLQFRAESFIGNTELRSLDPAARALVVSRRDGQQRLFDRVVGQGVADGVFTTEHPVETSRFVVNACTSVAGWFNDQGPLPADEIITRYQAIARATVGHRPTTD